MTDHHQHWHTTSRYQAMADFQWYLQIKWLDMKPRFARD